MRRRFLGFHSALLLACMAGASIGGSAALAQNSAAQATTTTPAHGGLARTAWLGVALQPADGGARIMSVNPAGSAGAMGLMVGDVITAVDGAATPNNGAVVGALRTKSAGQPFSVDIIRDGNRRTMRGVLVAKPAESFTHGTAQLGAVSFNGGQVRTILARPNQPAAGNPIVYFIQGVTCASIESTGPNHPYAGFVEGMLARGIAVYRIEKPGMGDSRGGAACEAIDYAKEVELFAAGYNDLTNNHGVSGQQIYVFGHSMGGFQAPALFGPERQVGGIAVMGTGMSPWQDYLLDVYRWQPVMQGADPAQSEAAAAELRPLIHGLMNDPGGVAAVAAALPEMAPVLRQDFGWDGGDVWMGRSSAYWRGIGAQATAAAWSQVRVPVLVIHGGKDLAVVDHRDARRIALIVNRSQTRRATYVELPETDHGFLLNGQFDPALATTTADWIMAQMAARRG